MILNINDLINKYDELVETIYPELEIFMHRNNSIELNVTGVCNLRCAYCYFKRWIVENKTDVFKKLSMDKDIMNYSLSEYKKLNLFRKKRGILTEPVNVELFGGDAIAGMLVDTDMMKNLFEAVDKYKIEDVASISIPSNGLYPGWYNNKEFKNIMKNNKHIINLSISLDGPIDFQIKQRSSSNWWNTNYPEYALEYTTQENFDKEVFDFLDFMTSCPNVNIGFHPMYTKHTLKNATSFYDYYKKVLNRYNVNNFGLLHIRNKDLNDDITYEDADNFCNATLEFYKETGITNWLCDNRGGFNTLGSLYNKRSYTCSILSTLYIDVDGRIPMCHRFKLLKDADKFNLGYVDNGSGGMFLNLDRISRIQRYSKDDKNNCRTCILASTCAWDCLAETVYNHGNLSAYDKSVCHINKISIYMKLKLNRMIEEYNNGRRV